MEIKELSIKGAYTFTPRQFGDSRGSFCEYFRADALAEATGRRLSLEQANCSVSSVGVVRGVHAASVPPSQAKYVTCASGAILDIVVDIRVGSPTFGEHVCVPLDAENRQGLFVSEGLGHSFISLAANTTVMYLCSASYNPEREFGIHPMDPDLALPWPSVDVSGNSLTKLLSDKDSAAPTFAVAQKEGLLPSYDECMEFTQTLT